MTKELLANRELHKAGAPKSLLIDDLIENDASYKRVVFDFLTAKKATTRAAIQAYAETPTQEDYDFWEKSYLDARKKSGCGGHGCSPVFRAKFKQIMNDGDNCIFESTAAGGFPTFVFSKPVMDKPYRFHAAINVLRFCELKRRNLRRFVDSAVAFMADPGNNTAPRLPDLDGLNAQIDSITHNVLAWMDSSEFKNVVSFRVFANQRKLNQFMLITNGASNRWNTLASEVRRQGIRGLDERKKVQFRELMSTMKDPKDGSC